MRAERLNACKRLPHRREDSRSLALARRPARQGHRRHNRRTLFDSGHGASTAMTQRAVKIDIVIPTRNTRDLILRCIESLYQSGLARTGALHCTVVDNASSDGTARAIADRWPAVDVVRNETNVGFATACNQGAMAGDGELLLILNSDIVARSGAVERLAEALVGRADRVAAGARLVDWGTDDTQVGFTLRGLPTVSTQLALLVGLERFWPRNPISRRQLMLDFDYSRTQDVVAQPAGACLLCRRRDFEAVRGFDEGFYYWFEDVDLVRRLLARGRIVYVHDAVFEHVGGHTFGQWGRTDIVLTRYRSLFRYFVKHHSARELLVLRAAVGVLASARVAALWLIDRNGALTYSKVLRLAVRPPKVAPQPEAQVG
jgi:N-acetylglucosaminyl-diphospho-decaprenol L-rhamnosyltransferase